MMLTQRGNLYGITGTSNREYSHNYEMMLTQRGDFYGIIGTSNREYSQNYEMMLTQRGNYMVLPGHRIESILKITR
jgi:DNA mismatch repair ATPase MutS